MFITMSGLKKAIKDVLEDKDGSCKKIEDLKGQVISLKTDVQNLKDEKRDLESKKKVELAEIEHLVKMKEEMLDIENQKKENELVAGYQKKEMELQSDYHKKVMTTIEKAQSDIKDVYKEIMARLPNVNVEMKR